MSHIFAVAAFVGLTSASGPAQTSYPCTGGVETIEQGRRKAAVYDANGVVIEMCEQVAEKDLPNPVRDAIHAHRRAIFVSAMKVTRKADLEYHITVRGSRKTAMVVKADGTVLSFQ